VTEPDPNLRFALLREPANHVSANAVKMWRTVAVAGLLVMVVALAVVWFLVPEHPWWMIVAYAVLLLGELAIVAWEPRIKHRIHRWEVTPGAVYTQSGWLSIKQRIAPLSRVQTVDTRSGPLMRFYGLSSVTITTASSAGAIEIFGLDDDVARQVVAELTEITSSDEGDAT
jgi:hypothetical protein